MILCIVLLLSCIAVLLYFITISVYRIFQKVEPCVPKGKVMECARTMASLTGPILQVYPVSKLRELLGGGVQKQHALEKFNLLFEHYHFSYILAIHLPLPPLPHSVSILIQFDPLHPLIYPADQNMATESFGFQAEISQLLDLIISKYSSLARLLRSC